MRCFVSGWRRGARTRSASTSPPSTCPWSETGSTARRGSLWIDSSSMRPVWRSTIRSQASAWTCNRPCRPSSRPRSGALEAPDTIVRLFANHQPGGVHGGWCRPDSTEAGSSRAPPAKHRNRQKGAGPVSVVSMKELLEAGVHFGHQTRRWNPKMKRFIFAERGGIYIIDLQRTLALLEEAHEFTRNIGQRGGVVLFVGTKKQAQDAVEQHAKRVSMPYVNHRWLGGLLTNWRTISERIEHLHELRRLKEEGQLDLLPPKERIHMEGELEKLEANLGGVADMRKQPDAVFIVDLRKEQLAVREARRLGLPVIALVDTNCDPDEADFVIPGNDDAIRACDLIVKAIADGIEAGRQRVTAPEFEAPAAAEQPSEAEEPAAPPAADEPPPEYEQLSQGEATVEPAGIDAPAEPEGAATPAQPPTEPETVAAPPESQPDDEAAS